MNSSLIRTPTVGMHRPDWLRFRKRGIGASDVGTIFGYNQYKHAVELFYERLGEALEYSVENMAAFMGHHMESEVALFWSYWNGTQQGMMDNYRLNKIVRKCRAANAYIQNPKYPWLFVSLDRVINRNNPMLETGLTMENEGVLELKTIGEWQSKKWEGGIPPSHIVQVMTQLLVTELQYGELATLTHGTWAFDVIPFDYNPQIGTAIIEKTGAFWQKIVTGRELATGKYEIEKRAELAGASFNMKEKKSLLETAGDLEYKIQQLEPPPDDSEAYEKFMKEKYRQAALDKPAVTGTPAMLQVAIRHMEINKMMKALGTEKVGCESFLKNVMKKKTAIDFGKNGKVIWSDGEPRRLTNKVLIT